MEEGTGVSSGLLPGCSVLNSPSLRSLVGGECLKILRCGICMEFFNIPIVLPCGHTFCLQCLTEMCKHATHHRGQSPVATELLIGCPNCRVQIFATPILQRNVTCNFIIQSLVDMLRRRQVPHKRDVSVNTERSLVGPRVRAISEEALTGVIQDLDRLSASLEHRSVVDDAFFEIENIRHQHLASLQKASGDFAVPAKLPPVGQGGGVCSTPETLLTSVATSDSSSSSSATPVTVDVIPQPLAYRDGGLQLPRKCYAAALASGKDRPAVVPASHLSGAIPVSQSAAIPSPGSGFVPMSHSGVVPMSQSGVVPMSYSTPVLLSHSGSVPMSQGGGLTMLHSTVVPMSQSGVVPIAHSGLAARSHSGVVTLTSSEGMASFSGSLHHGCTSSQGVVRGGVKVPCPPGCRPLAPQAAVAVRTLPAPAQAGPGRAAPGFRNKNRNNSEAWERDRRAGGPCISGDGEGNAEGELFRCDSMHSFLYHTPPLCPQSQAAAPDTHKIRIRRQQTRVPRLSGDVDGDFRVETHGGFVPKATSSLAWGSERSGSGFHYTPYCEEILALLPLVDTVDIVLSTILSRKKTLGGNAARLFDQGETKASVRNYGCVGRKSLFSKKIWQIDEMSIGRTD